MAVIAGLLLAGVVGTLCEGSALILNLDKMHTQIISEEGLSTMVLILACASWLIWVPLLIHRARSVPTKAGRALLFQQIKGFSVIT
ncbi:MAG: hypothetical protein O2875_00485 [Planctomycetota bacterium]|nr:hypothetical protein [Planctomycetota bacterium]MDA1262999.1 hypothetical protein [Planctomycetota bacterium]